MAWSRPVLVQYVLTYAAYTMAYCARKPFSVVKSDLKKDGVDIILAETAFLALYAFGMFVFVRPAEQFGPIKSLCFCYIASALCLFLFAFVEGSTVKVITWGLNGLVHSVTFPLFTKILVPFFARNQRGSALGIWTTSQQLGAIGATFLATWAAQAFTWNWAFYIPASLMAIMAAFILFIGVEEPSEEVLAAIRAEDAGLPAPTATAAALPAAAGSFHEDAAHDKAFLQDNLAEAQAVPAADDEDLKAPLSPNSRNVGAITPVTQLKSRASFRRGSAANAPAVQDLPSGISEGFGVTSRRTGANAVNGSFVSTDGKVYEATGAAALLNSTAFDGSVIVTDNGDVLGGSDGSDAGLEEGLLAGEKSNGQGVDSEKVSLAKIFASVPFIVQVSMSLFMIKLVRYIWMNWLPFYLEVVGLSKQTARYASIIFDLGSICGSILCGWSSQKVFKNQRALTALTFALLTGLALFGLTQVDLSSLKPAIPEEGAAPMEPKTFIEEISNRPALLLLLAVFGVGAFIAGPDSLLGSPVPADVAELSKYGPIALGPTTGIIHGTGATGAMFQAYVVDFLAHPTAIPINEQTAESWTIVFDTMTLFCLVGAALLVPTSVFFLRRARREKQEREVALLNQVNPNAEEVQA